MKPYPGLIDVLVVMDGARPLVRIAVQRQDGGEIDVDMMPSDATALGWKLIEAADEAGGVG